jgi:cytochrome c oxidase cbb3-type subunit 4
MDINIVREAVTVVSFTLFVGIVAWAWSGGNRQRFAEAARLPLDEDGPAAFSPDGADVHRGKPAQAMEKGQRP